MKKVLIVCGNGLGSSFIVEMNVKKILAEMNKEAEVAHTDLTSAKSETADLILSAKDIAEHLSSHSAPPRRPRNHAGALNGWRFGGSSARCPDAAAAYWRQCPRE
ncbi:TPA: PTS sugar transporter subunit IIB [Klebsiella pneumoniae]